MDVKPGAILGMTSKPDFDLNSPNKISNKVLAESISAISSHDEQKKATTDALYAQWRNRDISDTYAVSYTHLDVYKRQAPFYAS